jgi:hypothetical protein
VAQRGALANHLKGKTVEHEREMTTITQVMVAHERRIRSIEKGSKQLTDVVAAVLRNGGKGTVTLKFMVEQTPHDDKSVIIKCKVTSTEPEEKLVGATVYQNENLSLTKTDPRQLELLAEREAERAERTAAGITSLDQVGRGAAREIA